MGVTIDAWIEYDDSAVGNPEGVSEPPFSELHDNCIPLEHFVRFSHSKDHRLFAVLSGSMRRDGEPEPLFAHRRGLPPNVSGYTKHHTYQIADDDAFCWLTYPEIQREMMNLNVQSDELSLASNLVLDLMQSIEKRLGPGSSRLIFFIE